MNRIKIFFVLLFFGTQKAWSICTEEQSAKMASCTVEFMKSLGLQESDNRNPIDIVLKLLESASEIDNLCEMYKVTKECIGPEIIENCKEDFKTDVNSLASVGDYMELVFKFMNIGGYYVCEKFNSEIKELYSCGLSRCKIASSSCETTQSTIDECVEESQDLCPKSVLPFLKPALQVRECFKMPECKFCDPKIAEKVKQFSKINMKSSNDVVKEYIKDPLNAKVTDFDDTQIAYLVGFLQMKDKELQQGALLLLSSIALSGTTVQKKLIVNLNIIPTLCKMLNVQHSSSSAEADIRTLQFTMIYLLHAKVDGVIEQFAQNGGEEILKEFINAENEDTKLIANSFSEDLEKYFEKRSSNRNFKSKVEIGSKETKEFFNGISNADDEIQLSALKEYRKLLARGKISTNAGVEGGIIPILGKLLSSKNAEIQAESAWILKYFVKDLLNAMVEEDVIPALIRTLVSTDAKVLRHAIETLAVIIKQQPKLRNLFLDSHILEPLLMSYSDEIGKEALEKIAAILARLIHEKIPEENVILLVPVLSELIYTYDSNTLIQIIPALLIEDTEELIDKHFINLLFNFLENDNENIRGSACVMLAYAADDKDRLQYMLENGVLEKIAENFIGDPYNGYYVLLLVNMVIKHGNTKQVDDLLSTPLIPYLINVAKQDDDMTESIAFVFNFFILKGTSKHHDYLIKLDIVSIFLKSLRIGDDEDIQHKIINAIRHLLKKEPRILTQIMENDGIKILRKFASSNNFDLRRDASKLLKEIGINSNNRREL